MARLVTVIAWIFGMTLGATAHVAFAEDEGPKGIVDNPCPAAEPTSPQLRELTERILQPGENLSPDQITQALKSPEWAAYIKRAQEQKERDWPNLCRFKEANSQFAGKTVRVVYLGDSITENWLQADPDFFRGENVNRGIGGQTAPQLVLRFYPDVIALHPKVVHLMIGTNDIGGNTGPSTLEDYHHNIDALLDLAQIHDIRVVLAAIPPSRYNMGVQRDPRPQIMQLNEWLRRIAGERHAVFVDYARVLADSDGGIKEAYSHDNVHPTREAYMKMRPLAEQAVAQALRQGHGRP